MISRFTWKYIFGYLFFFGGLAIVLGFLYFYFGELNNTWLMIHQLGLFIVGIVGGVFIGLGVRFLIQGYVEKLFFRLSPPPSSFPNPNFIYKPPFQPQIRYCMNCKKQIPFDSNLCPYCEQK